MMLKYGMKKMPHARAAMKGLAALFFAAMMLFGVAVAEKDDPLKPDDNAYSIDGELLGNPTNADIVLHKQAERIGPDEWEVTISADVGELEVEAPQLEVVFVLDSSSSMRECANENEHRKGLEDGRHEHSEETCKLICTNPEHTFFHFNDCWDCDILDVQHSINSACIDWTAGISLTNRLTVAVDAIDLLIGSLPKGTHIGRVAFGSEFNQSYVESFSKTYFRGETYLMNGVNLALSDDRCFTEDSNTKILVIVTDGAATDEKYSSDKLTAFTNAGGIVFTVGFNHVDPNLKGMVANGGAYYHATNPGELTTAFDNIAYKITAMVVDPMGPNVNFDITDTTLSSGKLTTSDDTLYWTPGKNQELSGKVVEYRYKVKLNKNADLTEGTHEEIPLNNPTTFRYSITSADKQTHEYALNFPIPEATYAISSVQVKWVDEKGNSFGNILPEYKPTEVETIFSDYEWTTEDGLHEVYTPEFETNYVTITKKIPLEDGSGAYYRYVNTTYTADGAALNGVEDVNAKEAKEYQIVHHYMLVTPDAAVISGVKRIEGREFEARDTFTFTLQALTEGAPMPEQTVVTIEPTSGSEAGFVFAPISYTAAGTYKYTLTETAGSIEGMTYDETVHTLTVTVTETDGVITAELTGLPEDAATFTNTYQSKGSLTIKKTTTGADTPESTKFTVTGPNNYSATVKYSQFENGAYTLENLPVGTYTVTEDAATAQVAGYTLSVTGNNGTPVTVQAGETAQAEIVNTYVQEKTEVAVRKVWVGNEKAIPESLMVELLMNGTPTKMYVELDKVAGWSGGYDSLPVYDVNGDPIVYSWREVNAPAYYSLTDVTVDGTLTTLTNTYTPDPVYAGIAVRKTLEGRTLNVGEFSFELKDAAGEVVQTKQNDATGNVTFDEIEYTAAGTYAYTITEVNNGLGGVTYDDRTVTATVTVTDNHQGVLEAEVSYKDGSKEFVNNYKADSTSASLAVSKTLNGRALNADEFKFELKGKDGKVLQTKQNAANGSVSFDPITYNTAGEYAYTISEIVPTDKAGVRYDTDTVSATVTVTDNGDGTLSADVEYADNDVTFINEYVPLAAEVVFTASKELTGRTLNAGEFSFELKNATGGVLQTKQNAANGSVTFDPITYETAGIHTYTISEVQGNLVGVTYDKNAYPVSVEVTDDGKGKLTAVTTGAEGIVFKNTYEANGSFIFRARKELQGCELKQGMFSFELKDPKTGKTLQTKSNDKDGLVVFDALAYTQEHIGETFTYTISEVDDQNDFFTHDPTVHQVSVTVSVADDGRLSMETRGVPQSGEVQFVNAVLPTEFRVTKVWEGGDGEISLTLYADREKLDPQPVCTRDGNVYTYTGLPICDMEGGKIVYCAVETPVEGFMTVYRNTGAFVNETGSVYHGGQIINRALTDVRVRKVWNGLRSDEVRPPITLTLYRNGVKMNVPTPAPDKDGWYTFPGLLMNDNGKAVVYTVKEEPVQGFVTTYINNGVESTDCAQNGGTIVNSKIPSTGDRSDLAFWMTMLAASGALLALTAVCRRKRMN